MREYPPRDGEGDCAQRGGGGSETPTTPPPPAFRAPAKVSLWREPSWSPSPQAGRN